MMVLPGVVLLLGVLWDARAVVAKMASMATAKTRTGGLAAIGDVLRGMSLNWNVSHAYDGHPGEGGGDIKARQAGA
jgi:hypothetical protein